MKPSYQQVPRTSAKCKDGTGRPKKELHPFSLILLILWGSFTVGLLCLLHVAATHGPGSAANNDNFHPSWALITLPTILLTVFTQAHVPITAFHLARIAVSALQHPNTIPNSWAELFWLADQEWTGPVGIIKTTYLSIRSRTRTSCIYILFATTCTVALVIPVLLSQAYQVRQVLIMGNREIQLSAVSLPDLSLATVGDGSILPDAAGLASWETGLSVTDMYNTSVFIPGDRPHNTALHPRDFFFASNVGNASVTLPGLHLQGNCAPVNVPDPLFLSDNLTIQMDFLNQSCRSHGIVPDDVWLPLYLLRPILNASLTLVPCNQLGPGSESMILLYNYDRSSQIKMHGLIQCNSTLRVGNASISGVSRTYTNFTPHNETEQGAYTPLFKFLGTLTFRPQLSTEEEDEATKIYVMEMANAPVFRSLGFDATLPDPPSSENISESLWSGAAHYVASLATQSEQIQHFNASVPMNVALYTHNTPYAVSAYVMLTLWLALLAGATAWGYRRTFSPGLNSYVAAELIYREGSLLEDVPIGAAGDNNRLKAPFKPVGLCGEMELELELAHRRNT